MRRALRIIGAVLIAAGLLTLAWAVLVWQWQDPFTSLYTHFEQRRLASSYDERFKAFKPLDVAGASFADECTHLHPLGGQESHMIARAAGADALVFVPRGDEEIEAGRPVRYLSL